MHDTYLKSTGHANIYTQNNDERNVLKTDWNVDYDGDVEDLDLVVSENGNVEHMHRVFDKHDLAAMLQLNSVNKPLDERLRNDFLVDTRVYKV